MCERKPSGFPFAFNKGHFSNFLKFEKWCQLGKKDFFDKLSPAMSRSLMAGLLFMFPQLLARQSIGYPGFAIVFDLLRKMG